MDLRFVSNNPYKIKEVQRMFKDTAINIIPVDFKIKEIQTENIEDIVKDKVKKAFNEIGRHLIVEHTGLYIKNLGNLPGGLTQVFWDKLGAERFTSLFGQVESSVLEARTVIAYCDTLEIHFFEGIMKGICASEPRGCREFQWDCVFIPDGYHKTFAELGEEKEKISMRKKALEELHNYLKTKI
jgi:XTP/dITP diphosphohydrolase